MQAIDEIKGKLKSGKLVYGTDTSKKKLIKKELEKLFLAANVPQEMEEDLSYYADLNETQIVKLDVPNYELGVMCKKPYAIAVIGLAK